ncbi:MAG: hypothetical protein ACLQU2_22810, partial [Candidatus Binataceae bacterium]
EYWRSTAPPAAMILFLAFLAAGSGFIILAKLTLPPGYKLVVVMVPVLIMVTYALMALLVRSIRLRDDQTGDNLYYMGFIFTLTSLAVALAQFEQGTGFDEIVRDFGVAISSTITGIALRVIFNQMRQDPIEVEHAARQELAEASRRVRHQLDETVLAFNHFRTQTVQSLEEAQEELRKRLLSQDADIAARAGRPIEEGAAKIGAALQAFAAAIDSTSSQLGTETSKIAKSVGDIDSAMATLNARLAAMQTPDRVIEVKLEPVVQTLADAVAEYSRHSQAHSQALTRAVDALARGKAGKPRSRWRFWRR